LTAETAVTATLTLAATTLTVAATADAINNAEKSQSRTLSANGVSRNVGSTLTMGTSSPFGSGGSSSSAQGDANAIGTGTNSAGDAASKLNFKKPKGGRDPNIKGKEGEKATNSDEPGKKEKYTGASGKKREADKGTETTVEETKNTAYQYLSTQIKDGVQYAKDTKRNFILWLRESTKVSKPLQEKVNQGIIKRKKIPGSK
jgi:hypothetical protein